MSYKSDKYPNFSVSKFIKNLHRRAGAGVPLKEFCADNLLYDKVLTSASLAGKDTQSICTYMNEKGHGRMMKRISARCFDRKSNN